MITAFEQEFHLNLPAATAQPPPPPFSLEAARVAEPYLPLVLEAFEQAQIGIEMLLPEYGVKQFEFSSAPADPLKAADEAVIARELVREVARRRGGRASFSPLADPDQPGNGLHIHFSFRDSNGTPRTHDPGGPAGLSKIAYHFASGILEHLPALCAITAPTPVSYLRLTPHRWSAGYAYIGPQNREATIRIPPVAPNEPSPQAQLNLEFRAADGASCPHFALAALILAGIDGVRRTLEGPIFDGDPETLSADERRERGIAGLPSSLNETLEAFGNDPLIDDSLSPDLRAAYLSLKRAELEMVGELAPTEACRRYALVY